MGFRTDRSANNGWKRSHILNVVSTLLEISRWWYISHNGALKCSKLSLWYRYKNSNNIFLNKCDVVGYNNHRFTIQIKKNVSSENYAVCLYKTLYLPLIYNFVTFDFITFYIKNLFFFLLIVGIMASRCIQTIFQAAQQSCLWRTGLYILRIKGKTIWLL